MIVEDISEHEHMLLAWLEGETPAQQRSFLEDHLTLLDKQSDILLTALEDEPDPPFRWEFLEQQRDLLQDGRKGGGDQQAVRTAYVNRYSGFVLDLPDWLRDLVNEINATEVYAPLKERLQEALALTQDTIAAESQAELCYRLALTCEEQADAGDNPQFLVEALTYSKSARQIYTHDRYPYQFAKVASITGRIYYQISSSSKRPGFYLKQAIDCYDQAATIWTAETFPTSWVRLQKQYADALLDLYQHIGQESDVERARQLLHALLASDLLDASDTLTTTISLARICFFLWSRSEDTAELAHGLRLASMAREYALMDEHFAEYRSDYASLLNILGILLGAYYSQTRSRESLERCIEMRKETLVYALPTDKLLYLWQTQLSLVLLDRYQLSWQAEDLTQALQLVQEALQFVQKKTSLTQDALLEPEDTVDEDTVAEEQIPGQEYAPTYFAVGYALLAQHLTTWQATALDQAIDYLEKAIACTPPFSPDLSAFLTFLSDALIRRHEVKANLTDIEQGITRVASLLRKMPDSNVLSASQLYCVLGLYLNKRYELLGDYEDLTTSIDIYRYALYGVPLQSSLYGTLKANLGAFLIQKYFVSGNSEDIEEAIRCCEIAIAVTPPTSRILPFYQLNLAAALQNRYIYGQKIEMLEQAIFLLLDTRRHMAARSPLQGAVLLLLTDILSQLYNVSGHRGYIDLAIDISRQTLQIVSVKHPRGYLYLYELSRLQSLLYMLTGRQEELEEMLRTSREAIELMPAASPYRSLLSHSISISFLMRYERTGSLEDLDQAIIHLKETVATLPENSPLYSAMQDGLGECFLDRFQYTNQNEELIAAQKNFELAVISVSSHSYEQSLYQIHLGITRLLLVIVGQQFENLHRIVTEMQEALTHIRPDYVQWHICANIVIKALCISYELNGMRVHLDDAIVLSTNALKLVPETALVRVHLLMNTGRSLRARSLLPGQEEDREKASAYFEEACKQGLDHSMEAALESAAIWGNWMAQRGDWDEAGRAYGYAIQALNLLYHEQVLLTNKRQRLSTAQRLDTLNWNWVNIYEQAAYAQARVNLIREAVTSLELGRARELGEKLARDRADLQDLERKQPVLYQRYIVQIDRLKQLENTDLAGSEAALHKEVGVTATPLVEQIRQARAVHAETISEIRRVEGYAHFLLEPSYEQIAQVALPDRPLVYVVATLMGSMVLLVPASGQEPEVIWADELKLSDLSLVKIQDGQLVGGYLAGQSASDWMSSTLTDSLPTIGASLVKRLALRLTEMGARGVVLIPTGGSGMIPFHAAPYIREGQEMSLIEQFDVSYTPSARALATARNEASKRRSRLVSVPQHLLGVGNPLPTKDVGKWVQDEITRQLQTLQEYIDDALALLDQAQTPLEPLPEGGKGMWVQEEISRLRQQVQAYLAANPSALDKLEEPDLVLVRIFTASWQRAWLELQKQSAQPPEVLIEQGLSFRYWAIYFAHFRNVLPEDMLANFEAISQRISPTLAYTDIEMESIQKRFDVENVTTFYGSMATRDALWDTLPKASILHLACHASFDNEKPLESSFLLAQETSLTLRNLLEADEPRLALLQLAVLPACQTAVTDMQTLPNEAIGLFAGFLYAGVPSVIGTLWSVEQRSAALLMIRFYDLYLGDPQQGLLPRQPATALRLAQCWLRDLTYDQLYDYLQEQVRLRERYKICLELGPMVRTARRKQQGAMRPYEHSYYWAAFVYYGA